MLNGDLVNLWVWTLGTRKSALSLKEPLKATAKWRLGTKIREDCIWSIKNIGSKQSFHPRAKKIGGDKEG